MKLVFITYLNRSGSTFLMSELSKCSSLLIVPEGEVLVDLFLQNPNRINVYDLEKATKIGKLITKDRKVKYWNLKKESLINILQTEQTNFEHFKAIISLYKNVNNANAEVVVFKANSLFAVYERLAANADVKLVALMRDPRAIFSSQAHTNRFGSRRVFNRNPLTSAYEWRWFMNYSQQFKDDEKFKLVQYREMIKDTSAFFNELLSFCDVNDGYVDNTDSRLIDNIPPDQKHLHKNITEKPLVERINAWERSLRPMQIFLIEKVNAEKLVEFDYLLVRPKVNTVRYFMKYVYFKALHKITYPYW